MANQTQNGYYIYITAADPTTGALTLSDHNETDIVDHGADIDSIFWVVNDNIRNIEAITGINFEAGTEIFSNGPDEMTPLEGQKSVWGAIFTVGGSVPAGVYEEYNISWRDVDGNDHIYDPKIVVNP